MTLKEIYVFVSILISFVRSAWFSDDQPKFQMASFRSGEEYVELTGTDLKREFEVAMGKSLDVNLRTGGSINVEGWDKQVVSIEAHISGRHPENCKVVFRQTEAGVQITSQYIHSLNYQPPNVDFEIRVPENFNLKLQSMGGDFSIRDINGEFTGKTMGGALDLSGLKGNIKMTTMGGEISLRDSELDGEVQTMGGEVTLDNVIGDVRGTSMGGTVTYKNVKKRGENSKSSEIQMHSMGGDLNIGGAPAGANLHTMGGDITVAMANDHVKAETMGGDIQLDAVDGWIEAKTAGGDIVAKMVGDPKHGKRDVDITSHAGDIELTVPEGLSMSVDLQIDCSSHRDSHCQIISDFPLRQQKETHLEDGYGTQKILARGEIAGGSNRIRIRTVNGNIVLKK